MAGSDDHPRAVMVLTHRDVELVVGEVGRGARCDLELVEHLLRLQLEARRWGWTLQIRDAGDELRELFELVGLADQLD